MTRLNRYTQGRGAIAPLLFSAFCVFGSVQSVWAADDDGNFAIKGAGLQTCEGYLRAHTDQSRDLMLYAGWIDGFVTGQNQHTNQVYDLSSWMNVQTLLGLTKTVCEQVPNDTSFMTAFDRVVRIIFPSRLTEESSVTALRAGDRQSVIYKDILSRAQATLSEAGFDITRQDGVVDQSTTDAISAFQLQNGLPQTGLPDQQTLFRLFLSAD